MYNYNSVFVKLKLIKIFSIIKLLSDFFTNKQQFRLLLISVLYLHIIGQEKVLRYLKALI